MFDSTSLASALSSPLFLVHVLAVGLCLAILGYAHAHRDNLGANCFAAWLGANAVWVSLHTFGLLTYAPADRVLVDSLSLAAVPVAATGWLLFTLAYSGRWQPTLSTAGLGLGACTVAMVAFVATNPIHGLVYGDVVVEGMYGAAVVTDFTPYAGFWLFIAYVYLLYLVGVGAILDLVLSTNQLYRDQTAALVIAVLLPLAVATLRTAGALPIPVDLTPLSFGVAAVPLAYSVFRSELLQLVPASFRVGEETAIETLDQGVLVLDPHDRVVFANSSFAALVGTDTQTLVGKSLGRVLGEAPLEVAEDWAVDRAPGEQPPDAGEPANTESGIPRSLQHRESGETYEVMESQIDDQNGPDLGRTLFFRDVTEERRRKQRLLVLNRVVRHNLRNDMNVLRGHVRLLEEQADDESVSVIDEIATELIRLGEKAHQMDRIIQEASEEGSPVNVSGIVDRVVQRYDGQHGVRIEVLGPAQAWTHSHGPIVEAIVSNLVENAVEHSSTSDGAGSDRPSVSVGVTVADDSVTLTVADDGPGIPEQEISTLMRGEVSALQHGSGIGLWMVKWCVDLTNASWEIDTDDGTRVTITFPRRSEEPAGSSSAGVA